MHLLARRPLPAAALTAAVALCVALPALAAQITDVRVGVHPKFTRIVFELDGRAGYQVERTGTDAAPELKITIEATSSARELRANGDIRGIKVDAGTKARARIALRQPGLRVHEMMLADPPRIVIDLHKPETALAATEKPAPKPKAAAKETPKSEPAPTPKVAEKEAPKPEPKVTAKETPTPPVPAPKVVAKEAPKPEPAPKAAPTPPPAPELPKPAAAPPPAPKAVAPIAPAPPTDSALLPAPRVIPPPSETAQAAKPTAPPAPEAPKPAAAPPPPAPLPAPPPAVAPPAPVVPTPESVAKPALPPAPPAVTPPSPARPQPTPAPVPVPPAAPSAPSESWSARLTSDPVWIGGIAAALLGVAAIAIVLRRRRALPNDLDVTAIAEEVEQTSDAPGRIPSGGFAMGDDSPAPPTSTLSDLFDRPAAPAPVWPAPAPTAKPAPTPAPTPVPTPAPAAMAAEDSLFDDAGETTGEPDASEGDAPMNQEMDLPVDRRMSPPAPRMGGSATPSAPSPDIARMLQDFERRIATLEARLDESNEAREKLERQVAAQSEELRVQRAAIARTQRALRTMTRGDEDKATEPALRDGETQAKTRVTP